MDNKPESSTIEDISYEQNRLGYFTYLNQKSINKIPITWNTGSLNYDGVRPPNPSLKVGGFDSLSPAYPLFQIKSRSPYKVQYMVNKYGGHQTKMGTMLGI